MSDFILHLDGSILLFIQEQIRTPFLTPVVTFITSLGNAGIIWILFSLLLMAGKRTRETGFMSFAALLFSLLINNLLLKNLVGRIRPYETVQGLILLVSKPADFSFPSGHTGSSFASAVVLYRQLPRRAGVPALLLALLIGLSRLYVGVHYPTDVLVGMITGVICGFLGEWLVKKIRRTDTASVS